MVFTVIPVATRTARARISVPSDRQTERIGSSRRMAAASAAVRISAPNFRAWSWAFRARSVPLIPPGNPR